MKTKKVETTKNVRVRVKVTLNDIVAAAKAANVYPPEDRREAAEMMGGSDLRFRLAIHHSVENGPGCASRCERAIAILRNGWWGFRVRHCAHCGSGLSRYDGEFCSLRCESIAEQEAEEDEAEADRRAEIEDELVDRVQQLQIERIEGH